MKVACFLIHLFLLYLNLNQGFVFKLVNLQLFSSFDNNSGYGEKSILLAAF